MASFTRPTLTELVARIEADFISRLDLAGAVLRRAVVRVVSRVIAGASHMLHGHLDYLGRQIFPDESEGEYLTRQGGLYGITVNEATFATGMTTLVGTNAAPFSAGTVLLRADGAEYTINDDDEISTITAWAITTAYTVGQLRRNSGSSFECITAGTSAGSGGPTGTDQDITDGTVHWRFLGVGTAAGGFPVTAVLAGEDGNCEPGVFLTFESPPAGINSVSVVAVTAVSGGTDEEDEEDYRVRVLARIAEAPLGGADADYIAWAKEVSGVTRVWVEPQGLGAGTVVVRFVRDDDASPIPDSGEVATVQAKLDLEAPAHATPTAVAPVAAPIAFTFSAISPSTAAMKTAVEAELADLLLREGEPGVTILLSEIRTAIGTAAGIADYTLTVPAADVTHTENQLPTLGTVTWP